MALYLWIVLAVVLAVTLFRFLPVDASKFHTDPFVADRPNKPNYYISTDEEGLFDIPAIELINAFEQYTNQVARTKVLKRDDSEGYLVTYISRSMVMGFPDFISVKIVETSPTTSQIKMISRSRFGYSDLGVNRARVKLWIAALRQGK
jgi:uncharacterized protein (DUF1499 family)